MSFLAVFDLSDAGWIVLGGAFGYAYVRYKERVRRQQLADAKREEIESAKREAEALLREARVVANEEAIKLRSQAELAYVTYGTLAPDGKNAILVTHGYTSSHMFIDGGAGASDGSPAPLIARRPAPGSPPGPVSARPCAAPRARRGCRRGSSRPDGA